jgi:ATP phosphoribosyltransferase regulatory subunit
LAVAAAALEAAGVKDVRLDVGHVAPIACVLAALDADAGRGLRAALGRKDRARVDAIARGLADDTAELARALVRLWGPVDDVLAAARALPWPDDVVAALAQVGAAIDGARALLGRRHPIAITLDLGEVRGFDYYTGLRFAGFAAGAPDAVLRGGRYDELLARYGRPAGATGFAVDIEALAEAEVDDTAAADAGAAAVLVTGTDAPAIAAALRTSGVRAAVDLAPRSQTALRAYLTGAGYRAAVVVDRAGARLVTPRSRTAGKIPRPAIDAARKGRGRALARALADSE